MKEYAIVNSVDSFNEALARVKKAQEKFTYYQRRMVRRYFYAGKTAKTRFLKVVMLGCARKKKLHLRGPEIRKRDCRTGA